jgi:hypothetical protein
MLSVALIAAGVYVFLEGIFDIPWSLHSLTHLVRGGSRDPFPIAYVAAALAQTVLLLASGWLLMTRSEWLCLRLINDDSSPRHGLSIGKREVVEATIKVIGVVLIAGALADSAESVYQAIAVGLIERSGGGFGNLVGAFRKGAQVCHWAAIVRALTALVVGLYLAFGGNGLLNRLFGPVGKSNG